MAKSEADTKELDALLAALNRSAERVQTLWFTFLTVTLYFAITAANTTHRILLLEEDQVLPVLAIKVPLLAFYRIAPAFYVVLHFYMLMQLVLLARTTVTFEDRLRVVFWRTGEREIYRARAENALFLQLLIGQKSEREGRNAIFLTAIAWITLAVAPLLVLLLMQLMFLPYHSFGITWWHRAMVATDLGLVTLMWTAYRSRHGQIGRLTRPTRGGAVAGVLALMLTVWVSGWEGRWAGEPGIGSVEDFDVVSPYFGSNDDLRREGRSFEVRHVRLLLGLFPDRLKLANETIVGDNLLKGKQAESNAGEVHRFVPTYDFSNRDFTGADFQKTDLRGVNLNHAVLRSAHLQSTLLSGSSLIHVQMQGAELSGIKMLGVNLSMADLDGANLTGVNLKGSDFSNASLVKVNFSSSILNGARFYFANLSYSNFHGASLSNSDIESANLQYSDLGGARLDGVNLTKANLSGASLVNVNLSNANLNSAFLKETDLSNAVLVNADMSGSKLDGASLFSARMSGVDLSYAHLVGANMRGAWLQGANLKYAQLFGVQLNAAMLQGADLSSAEIQGADLSGAQLQGAILKGGRFDGAILSSAQMQGADLSCDLKRAILYVALPYKCDALTATTMDGAILDHISVFRANITDFSPAGAFFGAPRKGEEQRAFGDMSLASSDGRDLDIVTQEQMKSWLAMLDSRNIDASLRAEIKERFARIENGKVHRRGDAVDRAHWIEWAGRAGGGNEAIRNAANNYFKIRFRLVCTEKVIMRNELEFSAFFGYGNEMNRSTIDFIDGNMVEFYLYVIEDALNEISFRSNLDACPASNKWAAMDWGVVERKLNDAAAKLKRWRKPSTQ